MHPAVAVSVAAVAEPAAVSRRPSWSVIGGGGEGHGPPWRSHDCSLQGEMRGWGKVGSRVPEGNRGGGGDGMAASAFKRRLCAEYTGESRERLETVSVVVAEPRPHRPVRGKRCRGCGWRSKGTYDRDEWEEDAAEQGERGNVSVGRGGGR